MDHPSTRRYFLRALAGGAAVGALAARAARKEEPRFQTRGVVLIPDDLTLEDWPERAKRAGLTTIALHTSSSPRAVVVRFVQSEKGQKFLETCRRLGLEVEYELHAARDLLPRDLFGKDPALFRVDRKGARNPDANLCVHSEAALKIAGENALALSRLLRPTTSRYFLWGDDGAEGCFCPSCAPLSASDQALLLENRLLAELRKEDPRAQVAHLAYARTLAPPTQLKPERGVFLEFAPIDRRYDVPLSAADPIQKRHLEALDGNLAVFPRESAQALEYWLDASRFSRWKKPAVKLPFDQPLFAKDLALYAARGIRHVTSFAVFVDADYVTRYGEPPLKEYGERLLKMR